ncbi:unnamed protein product [Ilex paraguariensis]|uniref:Avr9/Cf-9 rapidly elicited protein 146 n=1 Tax=Ilex paraguariensis TaxID=185542 RepID=A0ABC8REF5_9AQUA
MAMEPVHAEKLWQIVKTVFYMLRKGMSKSKLLVDLHMMLKRSKIAGKAIGNLMLNHNYSTFSCRSDVGLSFVNPREYEFSCSNSPVYPSFHNHRRRHHHNHRRHRHSRHNAEDINAAHQVFDILNECEMVEGSPLTLPGFGPSPMVRQLRITDSPFPLKDTEGDTDQVDMAAEDFIKKFYKVLEQEKRMAALESPSPCHKWAR